MRFLLGCVSCLAIFSAWADEVALENFLKSPSLKTATVGVLVVPLDEEDDLVAWQADTALIPASTMKAITTASALQILGPDYQFETKVYLIDGNLVVRGGGDPTLGATSLTGDFGSWVAALKEAGVSEIAGDIIADPSRFESKTTPNEWPWGDVGNYYGSGPSGVNFHLNSYTLTFTPGSVGGAAKLKGTWPRPPGVTFENHMRTGRAGSGDQGYVYGGPGARVISMRGTVPAGGDFQIKGSFPDPPLMCATALKEFLEKKGIEVKGAARVGEVKVEGEEPLWISKSPSLAKIAKGTNHRSVNLYADSIFKALTEEGSTEASVAKVEELWKKQGVEMTGFVMHDGSGLSPRGVVTPRQMVMILKKAREHETGDLFKESLPVAGRSGTLASFGRGTLAAGRVWAKSGSLTRVRTYAGFFKGMSGKEFVFAVMVNNEIARSRGDIEKLLADFIRKN